MKTFLYRKWSFAPLNFIGTIPTQFIFRCGRILLELNCYTTFKFRKRKKNRSSCLYVFHKTAHQENSRRSRDGKEVDQIAWCTREKTCHVYSKKPIAVVTFLLQTPQPILNSLLSVVYVDVVGASVVTLVGVTEATPSNDSSYRKPIKSKQNEQEIYKFNPVMVSWQRLLDNY